MLQGGAFHHDVELLEPHRHSCVGGLVAKKELALDLLRRWNANHLTNRGRY
jgi:hypothetical protein